MQQTITLSAKTRTVTGKPVKLLRAKGVLPAVIYGFGTDPRNLEIDARAFAKAFEAAGESTLVDVVVDGGAPVKALIQDIQQDPMTSRISHADLRAVNMKEKTTADIPLELVGEAPVAKGQAVVITKVHESLEVEGLPGDLVSQIIVDLSGLTEIGQTIRVRDLKLPAGLTAVADADDVVVTVAAALTEEQIKAMETAQVGDVSQIEVVEGKKKEGEEGVEEGAAAPAAEAKEAKKEAKKE
ncbi:50S ribosomal protein L25 [Patescibacteria group bacterium]|nr:MAG: 50S ribosomal protein L25 [Patescibacteria group bacterium]